MPAILFLKSFSDELTGVTLTGKIKKMIKDQSVIITKSDKEEERLGAGERAGTGRRDPEPANTLRATFSN